MNVRQILPGEHLSEQCGHHCGVRSAAEEGSRLTFIGHCPCDECRCIFAVIEVVTDPDQPPGTARLESKLPERRTPMCGQWYARSGGRKPWE